MNPLIVHCESATIHKARCGSPCVLGSAPGGLRTHSGGPHPAARCKLSWARWLFLSEPRHPSCHQAALCTRLLRVLPRTHLSAPLSVLSPVALSPASHTALTSAGLGLLVSWLCPDPCLWPQDPCPPLSGARTTSWKASLSTGVVIDRVVFVCSLVTLL